jgi:hypothetical protein
MRDLDYGYLEVAPAMQVLHLPNELVHGKKNICKAEAVPGSSRARQDMFARRVVSSTARKPNADRPGENTMTTFY